MRTLDKILGSNVAIAFMAIAALLAGLFFFYAYLHGGNSPAADAVRTLEVQGYTDVQIVSVTAVGCLREDANKLIFTAKKDGYPVGGNVCGGGFSGWRVELH